MDNHHEKLDKIQEIITAVYRRRVFNPWDDGPKRARRYESLFRLCLPRYPVLNQTDMVYGSATNLAFLLHPGHYIGVTTRDGIELRIRRLGGHCFQALLEISHLGPFARLRFTRESLENSDSRIIYEELDSPFRKQDYEFLETLIDVLDKEGIELLPSEVLYHPVPDVDLDVTRSGCATIYHCLFDEE